MIGVKEYFVNAAVLVTITYLSAFLHKKFLVNLCMRSKDYIFAGMCVFSGWFSMLFGIHLNDSVIFDLRFIPIIIATLYARNPFHIALVGIGIGLSRYSFGFTEAATAGFIVICALTLAGILISICVKSWSLSLSKSIGLTVILMNFMNVWMIAAFGVIPANEYLAVVVPTALPANLIFSLLIIWIVKDLRDEYIHKLDLMKKALKDPLTQLYNRRAFMQYFNQLVANNPNQSTYSLAFLDLDHFKRINDKHGHLTGDQVLQKVSAFLASQVRSIDLLARYGGEEFVMLLPECTKQEAYVTLEEMRKEMESITFMIHDVPIQVTLSIGIASTSETKPEKLIQEADAALYRAKESGRNQIMIA